VVFVAAVEECVAVVEGCVVEEEDEVGSIRVEGVDGDAEVPHPQADME
jgi:hypothetical protein